MIRLHVIAAEIGNRDRNICPILATRACISLRKSCNGFHEAGSFVDLHKVVRIWENLIWCELCGSISIMPETYRIQS